MTPAMAVLLGGVGPVNSSVLLSYCLSYLSAQWFGLGEQSALFAVMHVYIAVMWGNSFQLTCLSPFQKTESGKGEVNQFQTSCLYLFILFPHGFSVVFSYLLCTVFLNFLYKYL